MEIFERIRGLLRDLNSPECQNIWVARNKKLAELDAAIA